MAAESYDRLVDQEVDRLLDQVPSFDEEVIYGLASVAVAQRRRGFRDTLRLLDIPDPEVFIPYAEAKPVEIVDIRSRGREEDVLVFHQAMGNGLDPNTMAHLAVLAEAMPNTRIISAGNPGRSAGRLGRLSFFDALEVWDGNLRPTIHPTMRYLNDQGVETANHAGYSFGAEKTAEATVEDFKYGHQIRKAVMIEPVSVEERRLLSLGNSFRKSAEYLDSYVEASNSPAFDYARAVTNQETFGLIGYSAGLLLLSNIAIAGGLKRDGFERRLRQGLDVNPELGAHVTWGSESELATDQNIRRILDGLGDRYGSDRLTSTRVLGGKHAMCDDIYLHGALVLDGLAA